MALNIEALETILSNPAVSDALKNLLYSPETKETKNETFTCQFTARELLKMPQNYRKLFKVGKVVAHIRKKPNGVYEIRVCIDGNLFSSSSKDLELAKEKFVKTLSSEPKKRRKTSGLLFTTYFETWLETVKKPYITIRVKFLLLKPLILRILVPNLVPKAGGLFMFFAYNIHFSEYYRFYHFS